MRALLSCGEFLPAAQNCDTRVKRERKFTVATRYDANPSAPPDTFATAVYDE
jgi:hypothetical protein